MKVEVEFWQLVGFLLSFLGFVFAVSKLMYAQMLAKQTEMADRIAAHGERLTKLEASVERMPSHNDLSKLYDKVHDQGQRLSMIEGTLEQINSNVRLMLHRIEKGDQ